VLLAELRRIGLVDTEMAGEQTGTIGVCSLERAAWVRSRVQHVVVSMTSVYPLASLFPEALARIQRASGPFT